MFKRLIAAGLVFGMAATAPPLAASAHAQMSCSTRANIVGMLKQRHDEALLGVGLIGDQAAFEIWRAKRSGSWTIIMSRPNNTACIVAAGKNWIDVAGKLADGNAAFAE